MPPWPAIFLLYLTLFLCSGAFAEKRVALVIGNSAYALAPLGNPKNDAHDLAAALKRLEFEVTEQEDLGITAFDHALDGFITKAKEADVALFFFSGHGVQIDKRGYLAPIDVKAETESSTLRELVAIQDVVSRIENSAKVSIIVLDACRNSPLQERLRRVVVERDKGLAQQRVCRHPRWSAAIHSSFTRPRQTRPPAMVQGGIAHSRPRCSQISKRRGLKLS